jgi:hypothetical protein
MESTRARANERREEAENREAGEDEGVGSFESFGTEKVSRPEKRKPAMMMKATNATSNTRPQLTSPSSPSCTVPLHKFPFPAARGGFISAITSYISTRHRVSTL